MKRRIICIVTMFAALSFPSARNDEWKDELYSHMTFLKALIGNERASDIYVRHKPNGEVVYDFPVLASGSTPLDRDLNVRIAVDPDMLVALSPANYHELRKDLWYELLPEQNYELAAPTCHMPADTRKESFPIKFKFSGLNLSGEWVSPLTVEEDPSYMTSKREGWRKALLHVLPYNDHSGNYSATAMNTYFAGSNDDPLAADNRRIHAVDENTVLFYVGTKEDNPIDRETYKINVKFEEPIGETETKKTGNLTIAATNPVINFQIVGNPTYEIWDEVDTNQPCLLHRYHVLRIGYSYDDVASSNAPASYRASGPLLMERKINILIPDQDQAIQWQKYNIISLLNEIYQVSGLILY